MPVVSEEMIAGLPAPVARSLRHSGVLGTPIPARVTVRQKGQIRASVDARWMRFAAREEYTLDPPGFRWDAALRIAGLPLGRATDSFVDGHGGMQVRLFGVAKVVDTEGPDIDQGSLVRWLNETMWFPAVWATGSISWEPIDGTSAAGSVGVGDLSVAAEFRFDDDGRLVDFVADRYRDGVGMRPWSTPLTEHAVFEGIEMPSRGSAVWMSEGGDFEYVRINATGVEYSE